MRKFLLFTGILTSLFIQRSFSQAHVPGPIERKMLNSICICINELDLSKITDKQGAKDAFSGCLIKNVSLLADVATERNIELSDKQGMSKIGEDIALTLLKEDCKGFSSLAMLMGKSTKDDGSIGTESGSLKRIENKGFNYFIISDEENNEKSFIWLRQFPGSENFMAGDANYIGKKLTIKYKELEVYLPLAKGYYNVKEITSISVL